MSRIRSQYLPFALVRVQGGMAVAEKVVPAMYGLMLYRLESASVKPHTLQLGRLEMCAWLCCQPGRASGCGHAPSEEFKDGFLAVLVVLAEGKLGVDASDGTPQCCHGANYARTFICSPPSEFIMAHCCNAFILLYHNFISILMTHVRF